MHVQWLPAWYRATYIYVLGTQRVKEHLTIAASIICLKDINKRGLTKQDHHKVINDQEMSLSQVTSRLERKLFLQKKTFNMSQKVKFSFKKRFSSGGNGENMIIISFYDYKILQNVKK